MSSSQRPKFTVIKGGLSEKANQTLNYQDSIDDYPDNVEEILALRITEFKKQNPQFKNIDFHQSNNLTLEAFEFIYREACNSEYEENTDESIEMALKNEQQKIQHLLGSRLQQIAIDYPNIPIDPNNIATLPLEIKEYLFSPPLLLLEDGSFMLLDDF